jgi:prostaglandin reductase 1
LEDKLQSELNDNDNDHWSHFKSPHLSFNSRVIQSKNDNYPVGSTVFGNFGWRSLTIVDPKSFKNKYDVYLLPDLGELPSSLALGALGMPGNSAYYGILEICQPKEGEVVVVSAAAGAVGSLVGQIAKIKGCRVIGFAGSDEKCKWLEDELNFDKAINHKTADIEQQLKEAAPDGIHCYFDNVGGELSSIVIEQMRMFGRISICGAITGRVMIPSSTNFNRRSLRMEGCLNYRWFEQWMDGGMFEMLKWVQEGNVKCKETITDGFENTSRAFIELFTGGNVGKAIVKI